MSAVGRGKEGEGGREGEDGIISVEAREDRSGVEEEEGGGEGVEVREGEDD